MFYWRIIKLLPEYILVFPSFHKPTRCADYVYILNLVNKYFLTILIIPKLYEQLLRGKFIDEQEFKC